jgi:hypothetical protein
VSKKIQLKGKETIIIDKYFIMDKNSIVLISGTFLNIIKFSQKTILLII